MATADQTIKSIEPGSIPFGDRAGLEQNIVGQLAGGGNAQPGQPSPGGASPVSTADPLGALTSGSIDPGGAGVPLTDGISVGPGDGGAADVPDDQQMRLQLLVVGSRSPAIRSAARLALLRYAEEKQ